MHVSHSLLMIPLSRDAVGGHPATEPPSFLPSAILLLEAQNKRSKPVRRPKRCIADTKMFDGMDK